MTRVVATFDEVSHGPSARQRGMKSPLTVIPSGARNLLLMFLWQKQIPRSAPAPEARSGAQGARDDIFGLFLAIPLGFSIDRQPKGLRIKRLGFRPTVSKRAPW